MGLVRKSTYLVLLENAVLTLSGVTISVVFARSLGPVGLGDWKLVMSAQTFCMYLLGFGLSMLVTRYTAEFLQNARIKAIWQLLRVTVTISFVTAIIASLSYVTASHFGHLANVSKLFSPQHAILIAFAIGLNLVNDVLGRAFLTGLGRRDWVALIQICGRALILSGILIASVLHQISLYIAIALLAAGYLGELLLYLVAINFWRRNLGRVKEGRLTTSDRKRLSEFATFQWLFKMCQSLREYAVDNFMLLALKGVDVVGIYGAAVSAPAILRGVGPAKILTGIILPRLIPRSGELDSLVGERIRFFFRLLQKITAILIWPVLAVILVLAEEFLLLLFGSGFEEAATPMRILLLCTVPTMAADAFYVSALALEKSKLTFHVSLWGWVNVLLNFTLIPHLGATGAAIGTGSVAVGIYIHFYLALKRQGWTMSFPWRECSRIGLAMIPLVLLVLLTKAFVNTPALILATLMIGSAAYLFSIRHYSPFDLGERAFLQREFGGICWLVFAQRSIYVR